MFKKFLLGASLALTLVAGGTVATLPAAAPVAVAQALPATAPLASAVAVADAAVPLGSAQMAAVRGAGIFSFLNDLFKDVVKIVVGVVRSVFTSLLRSWIEQILGVPDGGEKRKKTQTVTENYNSQADYDAGIVSSTSTTESSWVTTSSWSGVREPISSETQTVN